MANKKKKTRFKEKAFLVLSVAFILAGLFFLVAPHSWHVQVIDVFHEFHLALGFIFLVLGGALGAYLVYHSFMSKK